MALTLAMPNVIIGTCDLIHNERTKLLANVLNGAATSSFAVGVLAPVASDLAPKFYPAASSLVAVWMFLWTGGAMGGGAELFAERSARARRGVKVEAKSAGVFQPRLECGRARL